MEHTKKIQNERVHQNSSGWLLLWQVEWKLHKRSGSFYAKHNHYGGPEGKHSRLVRFWQVAFESKPTPALHRCLSNKIETLLLWTYAPKKLFVMHVCYDVTINGRIFISKAHPSIITFLGSCSLRNKQLTIITYTTGSQGQKITMIYSYKEL